MFSIILGSYEQVLYGFEVSKADPEVLETNEDTSEEDEEELNLNFEAIFAYAPHVGCIKAVASNGKFLASGSTDESIKIYNLNTRKEFGVIGQYQGSVTCLKFFGKHMFSATEEGNLCIWRTKDWECLMTIKASKTGSILAIAVHPSGRLAFTLSSDHFLRLWDLSKGRCCFQIRHEQQPDNVIWAPNGERYALLMGTEVQIFATANGEQFSAIKLPSKGHDFVFLSDAVIAVGGECGWVTIWNVETRSKLNAIKNSETRIRCVGRATDPDCDLPFLITASSDGELNIWNGEGTKFSQIKGKARFTCMTTNQ